MSMFSRVSLSLAVALSLGLSSCAEVSVPDPRNVKIPAPVSAEKRKMAINERPDSVMYLPLGEDVLVPSRVAGETMPKDIVGPFELRSETLAGALQLILADYDISIAFESEEGLKRKVTVANLRGEVGKVVNRVCSLADLYCSYEDDAIVVKDTQTFTVTLPPLGDAEGGTGFIDDVITGLSAVLGDGSSPVSDSTTRTIVYSATQRTAQLAENYFQRLRANTAMIVYETYIWEVSLNAGNSTGIDWEKLETFDAFNASINIAGSAAADFTNPISIGLPTKSNATPSNILEFLSQFGAVKTISQPQVTVLSGASAELRVADTQNFVSEVSSTISGDQTTTSVSTDSVDSGFTLTIGSSWDKSTVYSNININLTNVVTIDDFTFSDGGAGGTDTIIQLPQTTERELTTQTRVRPGDSVLIGGLVRETDNYDSRGPGFMEPLLPDSRTAKTQNLELVILMRPRVVVYTAEGDKQHQVRLKKETVEVSPKIREEWKKSSEPVVSAPVTSEPISSPPVSKVSPEPQQLKPPAAVPAPSNAVAPISQVVPVNPVVQKANLAPVMPTPIAQPYAESVPSPQEVNPVVELYDTDSNMLVSKPLSPEAYYHAEPMNVYEAYERSRKSYYAP